MLVLWKLIFAFTTLILDLFSNTNKGSLLGNENPQNIQHLVHHILNQRSLVQYTIAFQLGPWSEHLTGTIGFPCLGMFWSILKYQVIYFLNRKTKVLIQHGNTEDFLLASSQYKFTEEVQVQVITEDWMLSEVNFTNVSSKCCAGQLMRKLHDLATSMYRK